MRQSSARLRSRLRRTAEESRFAAVFKMASVFMDAIFYFRNFLMLGFLPFFARNIAYYFLQKNPGIPPGFLEFCFLCKGF